jgi:hypothetical protein
MTLDFDFRCINNPILAELFSDKKEESSDNDES